MSTEEKMKRITQFMELQKAVKVNTGVNLSGPTLSFAWNTDYISGEDAMTIQFVAEAWKVSYSINWRQQSRLVLVFKF